MRKLYLIIALVLVASLGLAACGGTTTPVATTEAPTEKPAETEAPTEEPTEVAEEPVSLNPYIGSVKAK